jgi:dsDNA-specific endonuclease/ATPase MutS2
MNYEEYRKLKVGDDCVIIQTGEPGKVLSINNKTSDILLGAKRVVKGYVKEWFNYTHLGKI